VQQQDPPTRAPQDQFSVVNNANYLGYVQHCRHEALASMGLSVDGWQAEGVLMALSEAHIKYKAPLRSGDTFVVTSAVAKVGAARVQLAQDIIRCNPGEEEPMPVGVQAAGHHHGRLPRACTNGDPFQHPVPVTPSCLLKHAACRPPPKCRSCSSLVSWCSWTSGTGPYGCRSGRSKSCSACSSRTAAAAAVQHGSDSGGPGAAADLELRQLQCGLGGVITVGEQQQRGVAAGRRQLLPPWGALIQGAEAALSPNRTPPARWRSRCARPCSRSAPCPGGPPRP